ncbi:hypothetical protein [Pseudomonas frederiksbergensis]|jgi:hypothetical protein|uniref:Lytic transglycosylase n=1 Tax=Pseudomonas frederiksbergensis TaxID=104087 RepID=A0A0B1Z2W8_9PSED|nr:hypothetical protein [Pseudomonas frederiksbergensis]KHK63732.1 lytic transglycosylase [Pseudomonas frederiksbergensis]
MKAEVYFCKSWFRIKKIALEPYDEAAARINHESGVPYTALIGSATKPSCFLEFLTDKGMVGVGFLDQNLREYMSYQFHRVEDDKLFLSMVTHREFFDGGDKVKEGVTYFFDRSGELVIRRQAFNPHAVEKAVSSFDPVNNYEVFPKFGEYSELIKIER